jgi:hypothetical protein
MFRFASAASSRCRLRVAADPVSSRQPPISSRGNQVGRKADTTPITLVVPMGASQQHEYKLFQILAFFFS